MTADSKTTPEQQQALDSYWSAETPEAERAAYARMMALGLPDGYVADPQTIAHSSAPWIAVNGEIVAADTEVVGTVFRTEAWSSGEPVESADQANLCLICAAPDLLEALKCLMSAHGEQLTDAFDQAHRAIAKAEGSST